MKNIMRLLFATILVSSIIFLSCQKEAMNGGSSNSGSTAGPHAAKIFLTDHETPLFDSVFIDIQKLEVKLEDDTLPNDGWVTLNINPGVYNILQFRNGLDTLFATGTLPNADIRKIRLTLGTRNSVMLNGQSSPLKVHSEDRIVVANIDASNFDISGNDVFFWIDFDASRSIQQDNSGSGNNNGYRLKSHIKIFTKNKSGRIEGRVLPQAADAVVMAINGSDTATAIPEHDGEFKIVGLNPGTYQVFYDGNNGYLDTTLNNIAVRRGEDTHVPTITLHQ